MHCELWTAHAAATAVVMVMALAGCDSEKSTRLTQKDFEKIAITQQKIDLIEAAGGMALVIGGETITSDEIIKWPVEYGQTSVSALTQLKPLARGANLEQFKARARDDLEELLVTRITDVLIYQLARDKRGETIDEVLDKAAESELRNFVVSFGGDDAKADDALREMGIDRKRFKELRKRALLVNEYVGSQMPTDQPITYRQMLARYEQIKDTHFGVNPILEFSLIDIQPGKVKVEDPNADRLAEAKSLADRLVRRLDAGEDFAELAREHSHDAMAVFGGKWRALSPESLVAPYDILVESAQTLEPGEVVGPIETLGHFFILKLHSRQTGGAKPFVEVQDVVKNMILAERQRQTLERLHAQLSEQAKRGVREDFVNFCLDKIHEISNRPEEALLKKEPAADAPKP